MQTQQNILINIKNNSLARSIQKILFFTILASIIPAFLHAQWITGPLVNAVLFLSVIYCGLSGALIVGMVPSVIALSVRLLPAPMAPVVPYIILGNAIMIVAFAAFRKKNFWLGAGIGALLKCGFLYAVISVVAKLLINQKLAPKVAAMFSWPQLVTALIGGGIAWGIYKLIKGKQ